MIQQVLSATVLASVKCVVVGARPYCEGRALFALERLPCPCVSVDVAARPLRVRFGYPTWQAQRHVHAVRHQSSVGVRPVGEAHAKQDLCRDRIDYMMEVLA